MIVRQMMPHVVHHHIKLNCKIFYMFGDVGSPLANAAFKTAFLYLGSFSELLDYFLTVQLIRDLYDVEIWVRIQH